MTECTVFVIENDAATRQFMQDILSDEGYVVQGCAWKAATIEAIVQAQARLLVVDLNPLEPDTILLFLMRLRQQRGLSHARMLVTSTSSHLLSRLSEPLQHLACETMLKPFELEDFLSQVTTLCADPLPYTVAA